MAAKDGKRPLVFHLKAGPRPTSPPIIAFEFTLMVSTGVDPLDGLGGNVSRPRRLVFDSRHARRDIFRHLVWTRLGFGDILLALPRLPPLEFPLWVFFIEGDVQSSFGCSNPVAFAGVQEGETVVDIGSGAGIDCLLSVERVGPERQVIGLDMTPVMVERARANAL